MTKQESLLAGQRVGVFGKGGCGKSTVTVLLAKAIADHGTGVCILDADSTNVGIHLALGLDRSPLSLIDYFGGMIFSGGCVTCPVDDPTPLPGAELSLDTLPEEYYGLTPDNIILLTAGKMGARGAGSGCDGPISKIARDVTVRWDGDPRLWIVDHKAGFEDTARGVITSLDWAIVVVDPTTAAIQMAVNMEKMADQVRAGAVPSTEHLQDSELIKTANRIFGEAKLKGVLVVLNRIREEGTEVIVRTRLEDAGITPIGTISEDPLVTSAWLKGEPIGTTSLKADIEPIIARLKRAVGSGAMRMTNHSKAPVAGAAQYK